MRGQDLLEPRADRIEAAAREVLDEVLLDPAQVHGSSGPEFAATPGR